MNSAGWLKWCSRMAGGAVILVGGLVLAGWVGHQPVLKSLASGLTAMNPLTAVTFQLAGCALLLLQAEQPSSLRHRFGMLCAWLVVALAAIRLAGYLLQWDIPLDRLLFAFQLAQEPIPNRMAPNTALCFLLVGAAFVLLHREVRTHRQRSQGLFLAVGIISFTVILGYIYSATIFTRVAYIPMALNTALGFIMLAVGGLAARPQHSLAILMTNAESSGMIARRLIPAAILIPPSVGFIYLLGERWGYFYSAEFRLALFVLMHVIIFLALIWWSTSVVQRLDAMRQRAETLDRARLSLETEMAKQSHEARYSKLVEGINDGIAHTDADGRIVFANEALARIHGVVSVSALIGHRVVEFIAPEDVKRVESIFRQLGLAQGIPEAVTVQVVRPDGQRVFVEARSTVVMEGGRMVGALSVIRDITERKKQEEVINTQAKDAVNQLRVMFGREERVLEVKREVNDLLKELGRTPKYNA